MIVVGVVVRVTCPEGVPSVPPPAPEAGAACNLILTDERMEFELTAAVILLVSPPEVMAEV